MSAIPPGGGEKKPKRMLPSVSDVVRELQGGSSADPGLLFKAARQVCADELARVKQGFEAAPLDVLVERARVLLDPSLAAATPGDLGSLFEPGASAPAVPAPPGPGFVPLVSPVRALAPPIGADDPFAETTGALDLQWGADTAPPTAPTEVLSFGNYETIKGPGEETLAGLERDAQALSLTKPGLDEPWRGASVPLGSYAVPSLDEPPGEPSPAADEPVFSAARSRSRSPLVLAVVGVALVGAGFLGWRLVSDKVFGGTKPTPAPYLIARRKHPEKTPAAPRAAVLPEATPAAAPPTVVPTVPRPTPIAAAQARPTPAAASSAAEAPRAAPAPTPTYRLKGGPIATTPPAPPQAVRAAPPTAVPARPSPVPTRVAAAPTPAPTRAAVPTRAPTAVPTRVAALPTRPPAAAPAGARPSPHAQVMRSPDWKGHAAVYVVHFTSFPNRKSAEVDAARLGKQLGKPAHAVQVDLGAKGIWYRAVVGEFATVEDAKSYRAELATAGTPSLGLVYYLTGE